MTAPLVSIVNYGVGNLRSVSRAFQHIGAEISIISNAKAIAEAQRLVLPGVGAFGHCMQELRARDLLESVINFAQSGKPFLGICVGMQIMMDVGEEFGEHQGLGLIPGRVRAIPAQYAGGGQRILPAIGWMPIRKPNSSQSWQGTALEPVKENSEVYFVHSYNVEPEDPSKQLAVYDYGELSITAAIGHHNLIGVQFHPEKSADIGLAVIQRFSTL